MQVAVAHKQACTARPISHRAAPYEEFFSRHYGSRRLWFGRPEARLERPR